MDNNYSASSTNTSLMTQMYQDSSEDQIELDWNTFSFESELSNRKDFFLQYFKQYSSLSDVGLDNKSLRENSRNKLKVANLRIKNCQKNHSYILSDFDSIRNDLKQIKETNEILKSKNLNYEKQLENLKSEESSVSSEYKQDKVSYQKAINFYKTHTDLNIDIKDKSDNLVKGVVRFVSVKHEAPILVNVDKAQRRIIDFSCSELSSGDVNEETTTCSDNTPGLICTLRENLIKSNKK